MAVVTQKDQVSTTKSGKSRLCGFDELGRFVDTGDVRQGKHDMWQASSTSFPEY